jgi:hypothetical protein
MLRLQPADLAGGQRLAGAEQRPGGLGIAAADARADALIDGLGEKVGMAAAQLQPLAGQGVRQSPRSTRKASTSLKSCERAADR